MQTCLQSCAYPIVWSSTPTFRLSSIHFPLGFHTHLGLPHPIVAHFHTIIVDISLMIWVSTCFGAHVGMNTTTHDFFEILSQLLFWKMDYMYRKRFLAFFPTMFSSESIFSHSNNYFLWLFIIQTCATLESHSH
jgi:hypothetical protein